MKYFPLLWATLWRKKARTILTLLSLVTAFLLLGLLFNFNAVWVNLGWACAAVWLAPCTLRTPR